MAPVVETSSDTARPILVTVMDEAIEPDATVAPQGLVRFTVMNLGSHAHDLLIFRDRTDPSAQASLASSESYRVAATNPGDSTELLANLVPGRYLLLSSDVTGGTAAAELTVQAAPELETEDLPEEDALPSDLEVGREP